MILQSEYHREKIPTLNKTSLMAYNAGTNHRSHHCMLGEKILSPGVWEKNSYRNQGYIPFDQSKSGFCDPQFDFSFH